MPVNWLRQTVYGVVDVRARLFPEDVALLIPSRDDPEDQLTVTYGELRSGAWRRAGRLRAVGIGAGTHVGIWSENSLDWLETWLACSLLGAVVVSLNPRLTVTEVEHQLEATDITHLFVGRSLTEGGAKIAGTDQRVTVLGFGAEQGLETTGDIELPFDPAPIDPDRVGLIQFTSGSTGLPKGAMAREGAIVGVGASCASRWLLRPTDRIYGVFSLAHNAGTVYTTMTAFTGGAQLILPEKPWGTEGLTLLELTGATFLPAVDTIVTDVLKSGRRPPAIRLVGGGLDPERSRALVDALDVEISNTYGQTEVTANVSVGDLRDPLEKRIETVGLPHSGNAWRIVDEAGRPVAAGEVGAIELDGWAKMKGYYGRPDDEQPFTEDGWVQTGDIGMVDEAGYISFLGRFKDIIRSGGENVAAYEIERALELHPDVVQAAVVPAADERYGEVPFAFITVRDEAVLSGEALRSFCGERLASFKVPKHYEFVESFPLTGPNKVAKTVLREQAAKRLEHAANDEVTA
jgi:fatty-acyl-CoA synthase